MPQFVVTPWRWPSDLLVVRDQFYPKLPTAAPELRRKACDQITAWRLRGRLPHALDATALITEAVLNDQPAIVSAQAIRAAYATAFSRFVTGLTDVQQNKKRKLSMFEVGKGIGLPSLFIQIRHQIAHEGLPSLVVLRRVSEQALDWLFNDYWIHLDSSNSAVGISDPSIPPDGKPILSLEEELRIMLRSYHSDCLSAVKQKSSKIQQATVTSRAKTAGLRITGLCQNNVEKLEILVRILLEKGMLIPKTKPSSSDIEQYCQLWSNLIRLLALCQQRFLVQLTDAMSLAIIKPTSEDVTEDKYCEAMVTWLCFIYNEEVMEKARKYSQLSDNVVLSTCLVNPGHWTLRLALGIINHESHKNVRYKYQDMIFKALKDGELPNAGLCEIAVKAIALTKLNEDIELSKKQPWVPKPIGIV